MHTEEKRGGRRRREKLQGGKGREKAEEREKVEGRETCVCKHGFKGEWGEGGGLHLLCIAFEHPSYCEQEKLKGEEKEEKKEKKRKEKNVSGRKESG